MKKINFNKIKNNQNGFVGIVLIGIVAILFAVFGYFAYIAKSDQYPPNPVVTNSNASSPTIVDTSGWKTYQNHKYGFELQYPKDWSIGCPGTGDAVELPKSLKESFIVLCNTNDTNNTFVVTISKESENNNLNQKLLNLDPKYEKVKDIVVGTNILAKEINELEILFSKNGNLFQIQPNNLSQASYKIFYQILSTFKFTK